MTLFLRRTFVVFYFNAIVSENSMNFIMKFLCNRYNDDVYDAILIIIDRFFKMMHFLLAKLT